MLRGSLRDQEHGHGRGFHGKCKEKRIPRLRVLACQVHEAHDDFSLRDCSPHFRSPVELSGKPLDLFVENSRFPRRGELSPDAVAVASADELDDAQRRSTRAARISLSTVPTGRCAGRQTALHS